MKDVENTDSVSYKRSLLIGMLLGNAHSRISALTRRLQAEFFIRQVASQHDLLAWKAKELQRVLAVEIKRVEPQRFFSFTLGRRGRVIHRWFHRGERKAITPKIRFMDHPIGLAVFLCDAGSVCRRKKRHSEGTCYYARPTLTIAVHAFAESEVALLLAHINVLSGAEGYIKPAPRVRESDVSTRLKIRFNAENSQLIWDTVKRWIPNVASMENKFQAAIQVYGKYEGRHPNEQSRG